MPVNVVSEWLNACSGCEISILNTGEALLDLLPHLNFVHNPALVDHKYFGQTGDGTALEIPEAVVGIVSGGVRNTEHEHVLKEVRNKVKFLNALGSCACFGGIPALANQFKLEDLYEKNRKKVVPLYPVNKKTGKIELPEDIVADLKFLMLVGRKPQALKRVTELTGAGLRVSKDYIDGLQ